MSALFGLFYRDGRPASSRELQPLQAALAHRGPDGAGLWQGGPVALGHLLLRTTAEDGLGRQPLVALKRNLVAVADARLDNRAELLGALGLAGAATQELSDCLLIMLAYSRWGEECARHLLGDFAFAIWDSAEGRLFCARDPFGVRTLYYYQSPGLFAFASEARALLALPAVPRRLNEVKVADFLGGLSDDTVSTFFEEVSALAPAHSLSVTAAGAATSRYWSLDPGRELRLGSDAEYAEGFRQHFRVAVAVRLRSVGPVGAMLSGGLDSSAIVCQARALLAETGSPPLHTFGAVFPGLGTSDEQVYLDAVIAQGGLNHHPIAGRELRPLSALDALLASADEPINAGNLAINLAAYASASEHGVRVVLDGFDGDTTVSHGRGHLHTLARTGQVRALWAELAGLSRHYGGNPHKALVRYLWGYHVARPMARTPGLRAVYGLSAGALSRGRGAIRRGRSTSAEPRLLDEDFARRVGFAERSKELTGARWGAPRDERHEHHRTLTWGAMVHSVELLNRAAAHHGVEVRFPFWDRRLVEYCLALPPEQKLRRGWTRLVMRHALDGLLPPLVQWRGGKADMTTAFETNLLTHQRELIGAALEAGRELLAPYVDLHSLTESYGRFSAGKPHPADSLSLFRAVSLATWLRRLAPETHRLVSEREGGPIEAKSIELSAG